MHIAPSTQLRFLSALQLAASDIASQEKPASAMVEAAIAQAVTGHEASAPAELSALRRQAARYLGFGDDHRQLLAKVTLDMASAALAMTSQQLGNQLAMAAEQAVDKSKEVSFAEMKALAHNDDVATTSSIWSEAIAEGTQLRFDIVNAAAEELSVLKTKQAEYDSMFSELERSAQDCKEFRPFYLRASLYVESVVAAGLKPDTRLDNVSQMALESFLENAAKQDLPRRMDVEEALEFAAAKLPKNDPVIATLTQMVEKATLPDWLAYEGASAAPRVKQYVVKWGLNTEQAARLMDALSKRYMKYGPKISEPGLVEKLIEKNRRVLTACGKAAGLSASQIEKYIQQAVARLRDNARARLDL